MKVHQVRALAERKAQLRLCSTGVKSVGGAGRDTSHLASSLRVNEHH